MRARSKSGRRAALLRELDRSGLSMAEFCRRRGVPYGTMAAWRSQARRRLRTPFVEVEIGRPADCDGPPPGPGPGTETALCAELRLPGGAVLRIFGSRPAPGSPAQGGLR